MNFRRVLRILGLVLYALSGAQLIPLVWCAVLPTPPEPGLDPDLLLIDLDRVRALVESESWVKEATVRRKLPDGLFIHITERQAVAMAAIDTELYIVDREGVILDRPGSLPTTSVPHTASQCQT